MPKVRKEKKRKKLRHDPLLKQMTEDPGYLKAPKNKEEKDDDHDSKAHVENSWATKRILENVREQQKEIQKEEKKSFSSSSSNFADRDFEVFEREEDEEIDEEEGEYEEIEVSAEDEKMLEMFMSNSRAKRRTLADIIMEKIAEHEARKARGTPATPKGPHPKVKEVYRQVAKFLSHYTSGKVPKAFKIIPRMKNWEEILHLTSPSTWTPQAMFIATRMFASSSSERVAQRFYMLVLLPKVREDVESHRRLNYHLYRAVKKAIFKPTAFFKGLLLPLAMDSCTIREAIIMSSILAKCSIPVLYASVAMMKLCLMEYTGTQTLFLKTLLNKKYNLPFQVIGTLVQHFTNFNGEERKLPVVWHQCLLVFVQRYKKSLTSMQSKAIRALTRNQSHHLISAEIRREIASVDNESKMEMAT